MDHKPQRERNEPDGSFHADFDGVEVCRYVSLMTRTLKDVSVNWSCYGPQTIENAQAFCDKLQAAINYAKNRQSEQP